MIGWLLKKLAATTEQPPVEPPRAIAPENCALWNDVVRALDAKPRASK